MKTLQTNKATLLAVEVSEGAKPLNISYGNRLRVGTNGKVKPVILPEDYTYTLLGLGSNISEEQWKKIVDCLCIDGWANYTVNHHGQRVPQYSEYLFKTATESGLSLLKTYGLEPETTVLLIQKPE